MTRSEVIQLLADKQPELSYKQTEIIIKEILEGMSDALSEGKRIEVRGFGSFSVRFRKPRLARNPKTGERVEKAGRYTPYFRPGKELRERVNLSATEFPLITDGAKNEDKED